MRDLIISENIRPGRQKDYGHPADLVRDELPSEDTRLRPLYERTDSGSDGGDTGNSQRRTDAGREFPKRRKRDTFITITSQLTA